ncbi:protein lethal(2)essential for life-like [Sitophilus oryzae]|uniref:Heat shock protein 21.1 n=1 Tax=Sitophilus oryzae TaxID=7048 RepID=A0A6J2Y0E0_SITOR|nr:protein lethal(2)essential for life-like [Sitophilus oryzae]QCC88567.1 heat shock protein 21.1 [Sitophilus oryzae]
MALLPLLFERPLVRRNHWSSLVDPEENELVSFVLKNLEDKTRQLSEIEKDSTIELDKDHFQASIDVQQFKPEEITVKLIDDNTILVEGKHEERPDEHGYISRHFVRKYVLPKDSNLKELKSKLSSDGVLSISAPKIEEKPQQDYKEIPIIHTGKPIRGVKRLQHLDAGFRADKKAKKSRGHK